MQASLRTANAAKAAVDEKLSNAHKLSEKTYQDLVRADHKNVDVEKRLQETAAQLTKALGDAKTTAEERGRLHDELAQVGWIAFFKKCVSRALLRGNAARSTQVQTAQADLAQARSSLEEAIAEREHLVKQLAESDAKHDEHTKQVRIRALASRSRQSLTRTFSSQLSQKDVDHATVVSRLSEADARVHVLESEKEHLQTELTGTQVSFAELNTQVRCIANPPDTHTVVPPSEEVFM